MIAEYKLKRKDGSFIWVDAGGSIIHRGGKPGAFLGIARDISARKQVEAALQESRKELESRIKARTAQLTTANHRLVQECAAMAKESGSHGPTAEL
jgi:hypothetical protein